MNRRSKDAESVSEADAPLSLVYRERGADGVLLAASLAGTHTGRGEGHLRLI